jgi:hypothetical protein
MSLMGKYLSDTYTLVLALFSRASVDQLDSKILGITPKVEEYHREVGRRQSQWYVYTGSSRRLMVL